MDKLEIREAILVSLDKKDDNKANGINDRILVFTNIKTISCIVDEEKGNAIDLETGHVYHVIQKEYWGTIPKEEFYFIANSASNTLFVYNHYKKNMKDVKLSHQMLIKYRALKRYQEYLKSIKQDEPKKGKTIIKRRFNSNSIK